MNHASSLIASPVFTKETLTKGQPDKIKCISIGQQVYSISGDLLKVVALEDEWYEDLDDPAAVIRALKGAEGLGADLLTFWQRMPDVTARYPYHCESQDIAVLPVSTYEHWLKHQIKPRVRSQVRKAEKDGLVVREVPYDDDFVRGMTKIFNESPVRQGRRFWHYGKSFETVKKQFSRFVDREWMIGAYWNDELVGLMMLGNAGKFALTGQIISSLHHRDKSPNNALIAKAVEGCAARNLAYLIYLFWSDDSLAEFKRRCGFERVSLPRYYVPLSWKGELALGSGLHRGWKAALPPRFKQALKRARTRWYSRNAD